jgi:potassium-transporting ATPase KdpC subunit
MQRELRPALCTFVLLTLVTGFAYPAIVTVAARLLFPDRAAGSLIHEGGRLRGSSLLGQPFTDPRYFWSRPSATSPRPYDGLASSGSNVAPSNPALLAAVKARIAALRAADPGNTRAVPVDLVTASASGLDPEISPAAADYQVARIARARGIAPASVRALVQRATQGRTFGVLGEARVNVLELNLALDQLKKPND